MSDLARRAGAELLGTAVLVFFAVGSAVFGINAIGPLGVAIAFGFVLLALAYSIGPISGCHVNPAVTLGVLLTKGISGKDAGAYVLAQFVGGIVGAALLALLTSGFGDVVDQTDSLGANAFGDAAASGITVGGAFLAELILTLLLVLVVLQVTGKAGAPGFAGLAIGLVLTAIHLVGIPLTGTSVNPARSLGPALFAGGDAIGQVWLFILAPLVGAAVAVGVWIALGKGATGAIATPADTDTTGADVPTTSASAAATSAPSSSRGASPAARRRRR